MWKLLRWFLFQFDAETAHRITLRLIRLVGAFGRVPLRIASGGPGALRVPLAPRVVFGMEFRSLVGLAAGFDKDGEIVTALPDLGFGFVELGTVTPRPQPGNDRPRLFRDPHKGAIFNRMGFNGLGATVVSERVATVRARLPHGFRLGINLGKNKDTPLEGAADDYSRAAAAFEGLADYLVVNVSSPNTPGLRSLQTSEALKPIIGAVNGVMKGWKKRPPLLLKFAPEVEGGALAGLLRSLQGEGVDGWVLTNTLSGKWELRASENRPRTLDGGWSGSPLTELARRRLVEARSVTSLPIISVGGIMSADEALERLRLGASLVQIYTGWIMKGPRLPWEIARKTAVFKP